MLDVECLAFTILILTYYYARTRDRRVFHFLGFGFATGAILGGFFYALPYLDFDASSSFSKVLASVLFLSLGLGFFLPLGFKTMSVFYFIVFDEVERRRRGERSIFTLTRGNMVFWLFLAVLLFLSRRLAGG